MKYMLRIEILFLVLFISNGIFGQSLSGEVVYDYKLKLNDVVIPREASLLFTDTSAVFYHSRGKGIVAIDIDGRQGGPLMSYTSGPEHNGMSVIDFYRKDNLGHTFYTNLNSNQMTAREIIYFRSFMYEEPEIPQQEWELLDSTKTIGDYTCLAAKTLFRGRNYFVWFTPEIPLPFGPWKLNGLPGVILEAADEERRIVFTARAIQLGLKNKKLKKITPPDRAKRVISFAEFQTIHWKEQLRVNRVVESTADRVSEYNEISRHRTMEIFE